MNDDHAGMELRDFSFGLHMSTTSIRDGGWKFPLFVCHYFREALFKPRNQRITYNAIWEKNNAFEFLASPAIPLFIPMTLKNAKPRSHQVVPEYRAKGMMKIGIFG